MIAFDTNVLVRHYLTDPDEPFRVSSTEIISRALKIFKDSKTDFSNCLIAIEAKANGCRKTFTFDKKAKMIPGMELV